MRKCIRNLGTVVEFVAKEAFGSSPVTQWTQWSKGKVIACTGRRGFTSFTDEQKMMTVILWNSYLGLFVFSDILTINKIRGLL
ncbi:hypothetical protein KAU32_02725 [bacterium]|nr:hypothetical protein [bacterium]